MVTALSSDVVCDFFFTSLSGHLSSIVVCCCVPVSLVQHSRSLVECGCWLTSTVSELAHEMAPQSGVSLETDVQADRCASCFDLG